jgi:hypothetical protein
MASTALLASKIVVLEEAPQIPAITALPSAVLLCIGITERGPVGDPQLVTSFDEYQRIFGGFTTAGQVAPAIHGFFLQGGSYAWVVRTCHYTDLTDPTSYTAAIGSVNVPNTGATATPAVVGPGSRYEPFVMTAGDSFDCTLNSAPATAVFTATAGAITDTASYPVAGFAGTETMGITVAGAAGGVEQTITATAGNTTALQVAAFINDQLAGAHAIVDGGQVKVTTDRQGHDAHIRVTTGGTLNAILKFPTAIADGGGNVGDIKAVTAAEVEVVIEGAMAVAVTHADGSITITTTATGGGASITVGAGEQGFGLDTDPHVGAATAPATTIVASGKTPGAYASTVKIKIEAATSGTATEFNLKVLVSGLVKEIFPNLTMETALTNYVETIVNHADFGSNLVTVADQHLALSVINRRPANQTTGYMSGGDDGLASLGDNDYLGNQAGPTGLYCFDLVSNGTILIVPGVATQAVHLGMIDYAEVTRNGSMFCVLDPLASQTAAQMLTYMQSSGLSEYSEYGAIYWPRIKVANPSTSVYGSDSAITVPPSGWVAGKYAANDQRIGGVYESPAGAGESWGVIRGLLGVEADPTGASRHQVLDERYRDLVYPKRINPITLLDGTPWHIDGGRTLKSTGNFPNVGERRGVIFVENTLKAGLVILKHRFNNRANRRKANRIITAFLLREMNKGAFRSTVPSEAFFVDTSDQLNPLVNEMAGIMTIRIGLATNKPAEFIVLLVTQDTRALAEELAAG